MRRINRRTLAHDLAAVLKSVLDTQEPVEVVGRDGRAVIITPRPQSPLERWQAQGLVRRSTIGLDEFDRIGVMRTGSSVEEILADVSGEL